MLKTDLTQWVGKTQVQSGVLGLDTAQMLHATVGGSQAPSVGAVMPALWHWSAFNPTAPMSRISLDGHPHRGDFMPPVKLPRRMWAGGQVSFHADMHVGAPLSQLSTITDVSEKSETMTFVTLTHETFEGDVLCVSELRNIVYLEIPETFTPPPPRAVPQDPTFAIKAPMSEALLFRYSAATFNAHRIHYDLKYAQEVEKYPGLVVHGPLQATLLTQAAIAHSSRSPATLSYRGVHPMFHHDDLHLFGQETADGMTLCTGIPGAHQGTQATITWKDTL